MLNGKDAVWRYKLSSDPSAQPAVRLVASLLDRVCAASGLPWLLGVVARGKMQDARCCEDGQGPGSERLRGEMGPRAAMLTGSRIAAFERLESGRSIPSGKWKGRHRARSPELVCIRLSTWHSGNRVRRDNARITRHTTQATATTTATTTTNTQNTQALKPSTRGSAEMRAAGWC